MADIYNKQTDAFGGSFSADQAKLYFAPFANDGAGLLVQNMQVQYNRQVTRLFEIGSARQYYVDGRSEGSATIQRILGPGVVVLAFYQRFGNVCNAKDNSLHFNMSNFCDGVTVSRAACTMHNVVITSFGLATNAQSVLINENLQFMFSFLDLEGANKTTG